MTLKWEEYKLSSPNVPPDSLFAIREIGIFRKMTENIQ